MAKKYKLLGSFAVLRDDGMSGPLSWPDYVAWVGAGNTPDIADPPPLPTDLDKFDQYIPYIAFMLVELISVLLAKNVVAGVPLITAANFSPTSQQAYTKAKALLATAVGQLPPPP